MEQSRSEKLLRKYENGKSNLQEEKELKDYLKNNTKPSDENLTTVFYYYELQKKVQLNVPIRIKQKNRKDVWLGLAASLVAFFGLLFVLLQNKTEVTNDSLVLKSSNNPEEVLKETQKALALLSVQVNVGIRSVTYLKEYQKSKNKIFKE